MDNDEFIPPCDECGGTCCRYVAIEIDRPATKTDYDHIRWYLLHEKVNVFVDHDRKWYVEFRTPCTKQFPDNRCGIYEERPNICRGHGTGEGECEFYDSPYSLYFSTEEEFVNYLDSKNRNWRFKKR